MRPSEKAKIIEHARALAKQGRLKAAHQMLHKIGAIPELVELLQHHGQAFQAARILFSTLGIKHPREIPTLPEHVKQRAVQVAELFERAGCPKEAAEVWLGLGRKEHVKQMLAVRIQQVQFSSPQAPGYRQTCLEMIDLAILIKELSFEFDHAMGPFLRGSIQNEREAERFYHLGHFYIQENFLENAWELFGHLHSQIPSYRDVEQILANLQARIKGSPDAFARVMEQEEAFQRNSTVRSRGGSIPAPVSSLPELPELPSLPELPTMPGMPATGMPQRPSASRRSSRAPQSQQVSRKTPEVDFPLLRGRFQQQVQERPSHEHQNPAPAAAPRATFSFSLSDEASQFVSQESGFQNAFLRETTAGNAAQHETYTAMIDHIVGDELKALAAEPIPTVQTPSAKLQHTMPHGQTPHRTPARPARPLHSQPKIQREPSSAHPRVSQRAQAASLGHHPQQRAPGQQHPQARQPMRPVVPPIENDFWQDPMQESMPHAAAPGVSRHHTPIPAPRRSTPQPSVRQPTPQPAPAQSAQKPQTPMRKSRPQDAKEVFGVGAVIAERYRVDGLLGEGGMASVFLAFDLDLDEEVALKVFDLASANEQTLARFKQELKLSRRLSHPNIIRIHDLGRFQDHYYISMEVLRGKDLSEYIDNSPGGMDIKTCVSFLLQICEGLQAAHDLGVVHRDVKPSNFFVTDTGVVKVMDFGIAKQESSVRLTTAGMVLGTAAYIAPEQIANAAEVTHAADLYALGAMAYEMCTGKLPFLADELLAMLMMHHQNIPESPRIHNKAIPKKLGKIILKLLEKAPENRFVDCNDLAKALRGIRI